MAAERVYRDEFVAIDMLGPIGPFANNAYIVRPTEGGPVVVVDAPAGAEAIVEELGSTPVQQIVVTHSHRDHWDGFDVLRAHTQAPVFASDVETDLDAKRAVQPLADGAAIAVGRARMRVLLTPGHTPGSICLHVGGALLSGDTLFPGGPGHSRDNAALLQEIESITSRLLPLPERTLVLPGHGVGTTIGVARAEHAVFASKAHAADLHGDVLWLES